MGFQTLTHVVDVYRLTASGNNQAYPSSPIYTGLDCGILPLSNDILAIYPGESAYALYEIYFYEVLDIKNGDKLKSGGSEWIVRGVPQVVDTHYIYYQKVLGEKVV